MTNDIFQRSKSIRLEWFAFVFAIVPATMTSGQQVENHLIAPVVAAPTVYFDLKSTISSNENSVSNDSSRRSELLKQAQSNIMQAFSQAASQAESQVDLNSSGTGKVSPVGFTFQDKDQDSDQDANSEESSSGDSDSGDSDAGSQNEGVDSDDEDSLTDDDDESSENADDDQPTKNANLNPTWVRKKISEVRTNIRELEAVAPRDRSSELDYGMADWSQFSCAPKTFAWVAPDIRYQPLYFEDVALERYGQTAGFHRQTFLSGCHFFKSAITFPNKLRFDAKTCDYPLGFCRPGTCVPAIEQKHYLGRPH